MTDTLKINGYSVGDSSVGIGQAEFSIDLGLYPEDVNLAEREWIIITIIRDLWELHDNGDLIFNFSDEISEDGFYTRQMTYELSKKILECKK